MKGDQHILQCGLRYELISGGKEVNCIWRFPGLIHRPMACAHLIIAEVCCHAGLDLARLRDSDIDASGDLQLGFPFDPGLGVAELELLEEDREAPLGRHLGSGCGPLAGRN